MFLEEGAPGEGIEVDGRRRDVGWVRYEEGDREGTTGMVLYPDIQPRLDLRTRMGPVLGSRERFSMAEALKRTGERALAHTFREVDLTRFRGHLIAGAEGPERKGGQVPRTRPPYPPEFRAEAVRLAKTSGEPIARIAKDLGVSDQTLRNWVNQDDVDAGRESGLTSDERARMRELEKENRKLREEREILRKAAAFFAAETGRR